MSDFESAGDVPRNLLHRLASIGGALLGAFLVAGALGHFTAIWPVLSTDGSRFDLLLPGLMLMTTGLLDIALCQPLWKGTSWSLKLALGANACTTMYLAYLLNQGVPDHPIGAFLALVSSYVILLAAIRVGLVWPANAA